MEDALYGIMLASANEVANAIAEHISGDTASFAELMTRRASALGAHNTFFSNPSGLHEPEQVSTACDMAIIMREVIRHPRLVEIMGTVRHDIMPTERQPQVRPLLNTNRILRDGPHFNPAVLGGKTGFTTPAQHTLATYAANAERELIVITLEGAGAYLYTDTNRLLSYAFNIPYVSTRILYRGEYARTIPVYSHWGRNREHVGEVSLVVPEDVYLEIPQGFDMDLVEARLYTPSQVVMPVQAGQTIGRIIYSLGGNIMGDIQLRAANTVLPPPPQLDIEAEPAYASEVEAVLESEIVHEPIPLDRIDRLQALAENYYLSIMLPLIIFFLGIVMSVGMFRLHRNRKAKMNRYSVIGSNIYRR